MPVNGTKVNFL